MALDRDLKGKRHGGGARSCIGTIQAATAEANARHARPTKPQPWIVRKLMVGVVAGLMGYTAYVYIAKLCVPMIQERRGGGRRTGVVLVSIFSVLFLWLVWAYVKVVLTPPGLAKDHIRQSERPMIILPPRHSRHSTDLSHFPMDDGSSPLHDPEAGLALAGPSYEDILSRESGRNSQTLSHSHGHTLEEVNAGVLDAFPKPTTGVVPGSPGTGSAGSPSDSPEAQEPRSSTTVVPFDSSPTDVEDARQSPVRSFPQPKKPQPVDLQLAAPPSEPGKLKRKLPLSTAERRARLAERQMQRQEELEQRLAAKNVRRKPPQTPVLLPVHRYCDVDQLLKPFRAHHCRICGTCVLKYDHHCPWIGQCVGARNHKFFYNFCMATSIFTAYTLGTLLPYTIRDLNTSDPRSRNVMDPQEIVIIALTGLFFLFTTALALSHTRLILLGQSTVESMQIHGMKERESRALARGFSCWQIRVKHKLRQQWDREWGDLDTEGNIWWRGSAFEEWKDVMGPSVWGWILPIGRSQSDGLNYPTNPRFDTEGRWRRREEWPEHLR